MAEDVAASGRERITVLIAAYQHEAYIAQCIESVLEQEVDADLEVLIGEDASSDGTLSVCERYTTDPRVTIIARSKSEPKIRIEGYPTGRANLLDIMARATGHYATRIDGDDGWCHRGKLQSQLDALRKEPQAMGAYHQTGRMDKDGNPTGALFREQLAERMRYEDTITGLSPFHVSSFLYRNTPSMRHPPALARCVGSLDLLLFAMAAHQGPLIRTDGIMSMYREHAQGISKRGLFAGSNNLRLHLLLWTGVVQLHHGDGKAKAEQVCDRHLREALAHTITRRDAMRWALAAVQRPGYFLGAGHRLRSLFRIVRKGFA